MFKIFMRNSLGIVLTMILIFGLSWHANADDHQTSISSDYNTYIQKVSSGYMVFSGNSGSGYIVEYYDGNFNYTSSKTISQELPIFGGFYSTGSNYFILSGAFNSEESDSFECYRLTKYDTSWNRISSCSVKGCNTYRPFYFGKNAAFDVSGSRMVVRACRTMYTNPNDGLNHQANIVFLFDISSMSLLDCKYKVSNSAYGYSSHSFEQYTKIDNGHIIGTDLGDAYPRAVMVSYYPGSITSNTIGTAKCTIYYPLTVGGTYEQYGNKTGIELGGLELSDSSYIVAGTSLDQNNLGTSTTYNIFVAVSNKSSTSTSCKWITSNAEGSDDCYNPHLVKISSTRFALIWCQGNKVQYTFIDGSGNKIDKIYSETGLIGRCQPILYNGKIVWFKYDDKRIKFFRIDASTGAFETLSPMNIKTGSISSIDDQKYTGSEICPDITVTYDGKTLVRDTDYTVSYSSNINKGTGKVTVTGVGKYYGTLTKNFVITAVDVSELTLGEVPDAQYTRYVVQPDLDIRYGNIKLVKGTDYKTTVTTDGKQLGPQSLTVTFQGNYTGTMNVDYNIVPADISSNTVTVNSVYFNYGAPCEAKPTVRTYQSISLTKDTDYTLSWSDNTQVGKGKVTITGIGNYTGTMTVEFDIVPRPITSVSYSRTSYATYTGHPVLPTITFNNTSDYTMVEGVDYTVSCTDNVDAGTATCTITGKGNFTDERTFTYTINRCYISYVTASAINPVVYNGSEHTPSFTLTHNNRTLVEGKDYTYTYTNNINAGTATITVTGIGNYQYSRTISFRINGKPVSSLSYSKIKDQNYTGSTIKPALTVKDGSLTLTQDTDYTLTYLSCTMPGTATVRVTGKGNYAGTYDVNFTIIGKPISDATINDIDDRIYTGNEIKPIITAYYGEQRLYSGSDYTLSYSDNINVGTATVTLTGKGVYSGTISKTFNIIGRSIAYVSLSAIPDQTYTGSAIKPSVVLTNNSYTLVEGQDYNVTYSGNTNVGTASVTITGIGNFANSRTTSFKIKAKSVEGLSISPIPDQLYTGTEIKPSITIKSGSKTLVEGTDYTVQYSDNTEVGTASVCITGKGNYTGTINASFNIVANSSGITISSIASQTYTGNEIKPSVTVKCGAKTLTAGTDYTTAYSDNINVGTAKVTVTCKGNYSGTASANFTITAKSLSGATIQSIADQTYTGSALKPSLTVKDGTKKLVSGTDYTVAYSSNTAAGTAYATVTGKGNYTGSKTVSFTILPNSSAITIASISNQIYTGSEIKPSVTVKCGSKTLVSGTDYTTAYSDNINVGTATVTVNCKGNYSASAAATFNITAKSLAGTTIQAIPDQIYTGSPLKPSVIVKDGNKTLVSGTDYTVSYSNNTAVGKASVTVTGKCNYTGTKNTEFNIIVNSAALTISDIADVVFTGSELTPSVTVKCGGKTLVQDTDYVIEYADNINAGTSTVTVTGIGNYSGTAVKNFTITPKQVSDLSFGKISNKKYTGSAIKPSVTVKNGSVVLVKNTDYTLSYKNNVNAGTATVTVTGKGNYKGAKDINFLIVPNSSTLTVSDIGAQTYTGSALTPSVTVKCGTKSLAEGTDYTVTYSDNINAGTATVNVTGKGNYSGTGSTTFTINAKSIVDSTVSPVADQTYTGTAIKPTVTVKDGNKALVSGTDYTVSYSNNKAVGTATITITGKGNYTGSRSITFNIIKEVITYQWKKIDGKWYYVGSNGKNATGFWTIDGNVYYFAASGAMLTKWQEIDGSWYYFASSGEMKTGWQKISKVWYYFDAEGRMLTGLQKIENVNYFFKDSGAMATGWVQDGEDWYYFASSGAGKTGWQQISKVWYYFDEDSKMAVGLMQIEDKTYFFKDNGAMATKWIKIDTDWYWFKSDGSMAVSETVKISGKAYNFDDNGVCLNP